MIRLEEILPIGTLHIHGYATLNTERTDVKFLIDFDKVSERGEHS